MERSMRAKQFLPFSAVKGLEEVIAAKEKILVDKIELSEDRAAELNEKMQAVKIGDIITIVYYKDEEYIKLTGMVSQLDVVNRRLTIVNTRISMDAVYDIEME